MKEFLLSVLQIIIGVIVGSLGTIGVQKYLKRDAAKGKKMEDIQCASNVFRQAFIDELSGVQVGEDDIFNSPEGIVRRALKKHRAAIITFKRFLSKDDAKDLELLWSTYSGRFEGSDKHTYISSYDLVRDIEKFIAFADRPLKLK